jgi:hypothetical protein
MSQDTWRAFAMSTSRQVTTCPAVRCQGPGDEAGHRVVEPLRRADGTTPGLILGTDEHGTTLQATEGDAAPTVIEGSAPTGPDGATVQAADMVELRFEAVGRRQSP